MKIKRHNAGDPRLGRHVEHDPKSRDHELPRRAAPRTSVQHPTFGTVLNQGSIGACTGFAAAHALNTGPIRTALLTKKKTQALCTNKEGLQFYSVATALDSWPGVYPPEDTGSSGLAVMKALIKLRLIREYRWAFGIEGVLGAIGNSPLLVGTAWLDGMFQPDKNGLVKPTGGVSGGHEYLMSGYQIVGKTIGQNLFWFRNSWGMSFGIKGGFCMTVASFEKLLGMNGDCVRPIV